MDAALLLQIEVARFKQWAAGIPVDTRSGEWECDYPEWRRFWAAAKCLVETVPVATWTEATTEDFVYALARDNEVEVIADDLAGRSDTLLILAARAIHSVETDAKWQIAAKLGDMNEHKLKAEALLVQFVQDADEYVSRRSLLALATLKSGKAESFAERAWQTGHEYQRIAALWALKDVGSSKLNDYLLRAEEDGREYVVRNATEIRAA
jgi:HEAT repeat protein